MSSLVRLFLNLSKVVVSSEYFHLWVLWRKWSREDVPFTAILHDAVGTDFTIVFSSPRRVTAESFLPRFCPFLDNSLGRPVEGAEVHCFTCSCWRFLEKIWIPVGAGVHPSQSYSDWRIRITQHYEARDPRWPPWVQSPVTRTGWASSVGLSWLSTLVFGNLWFDIWT